MSTGRLIPLARKLRRNTTDVERLLWNYLRDRQLDSFKFKRQQPLGNFIVDFICFERKLIVELDGGQHAEDMEADLIRTRWLASQGFQVIRFWNNDVLQNIDGVWQVISEHLKRNSRIFQDSPKSGS